MSVQVKNYQWHRTFHDRLMADPGYQGCNAEARGVYQTLRNLAGITNNNGSLKVGTAVPMDALALARWLAGTMPEMTAARARMVIRKLVTSGMIHEGSGGRIMITDWKGDQQCAWSPEAERQRRSRERRRGGGEAEQGGGVAPVFPTAPQAPAGEAAWPPPPPSTSPELTPSVTSPAEARDSSHRQDEDDIERRKKKPYGFRSSISSGGGGGQAAGSQHLATSWDIGKVAYDRVPVEELVAAACELVGARDEHSRRTYNKKMAELCAPAGVTMVLDEQHGEQKQIHSYGPEQGAQIFINSLNEVRDAMDAGKARKPPGLLTKSLQDAVDGKPHSP